MLSFVRRDSHGANETLVILNLTPETRESYRIGMPGDGYWREMINTDAGIYGGSGQGNLGGKTAEPVATHGQQYSAEFCLPPLSVSVFKRGEA